LQSHVVWHRLDAHFIESLSIAHFELLTDGEAFFYSRISQTFEVPRQSRGISHWIKNTFFVIGRKGTGKSAIYNWINQVQNDYDALVSNLSFKDFPFEKLLKLSDDNFSKPNQYQSIWRNIILTEIAVLIVTDQKCEPDENFRQLRQYVDLVFGQNLTDLHKQITTKVEKNTVGLSYVALLSSENSQSFTLGNGLDNITTLNRMLETCIRNYLKCKGTMRYIVQFDQLDDNYNQYIENTGFFQSIISLFKAAYDINQTFRSENIPAKTVVYLRSDIFYKINQFDAESARWDQFRYHLNWSIVNRTDWQNPRLLKLINKRISNSLPEISSENIFDLIFNNENVNIVSNGKKEDVFKYIIARTFHRPRDVIQFCIKIKEQASTMNKYYYQTIINGEKEYSLWLLSELSNEIAPQIKEIDTLYEFIRLLGTGTYSLTDFKLKYAKFQGKIAIDAEDLLNILYNSGVIINISRGSGPSMLFSVIRNDRSVFNRDLRFFIHKGVRKGLYVSKFQRR